LSYFSEKYNTFVLLEIVVVFECIIYVIKTIFASYSVISCKIFKQTYKKFPMDEIWFIESL